MGKVNLTRLYATLGINKDIIKMSEFADIFDESRELSVRERELLQKAVDFTYRGFTEKVAKGRGIANDLIPSVAEGRVFAGTRPRSAPWSIQSAGLWPRLNTPGEWPVSNAVPRGPSPGPQILDRRNDRLHRGRGRDRRARADTERASGSLSKRRGLAFPVSIQDRDQVRPGSGVLDRFDIPADIELRFAAVEAHVTDHAEHRPLGPGPVVGAPHAPGDAGVAVGVASVELVAVVERDGRLVCLLR